MPSATRSDSMKWLFDLFRKAPKPVRCARLQLEFLGEPLVPSSTSVTGAGVQAADAVTSRLVIDKTFTTNSKSLTVDYEVIGGSGASFTLDVYRSDADLPGGGSQ